MMNSKCKLFGYFENLTDCPNLGLWEVLTIDESLVRVQGLNQGRPGDDDEPYPIV